MRRGGFWRTAAFGAWSAALASAGVAFADTPAIDLTTVGTYPPLGPNGFNYYQPPGNYTFTFNFTANSPILVTQLGYYDSALGGVPEPNGFGTHTVSLVDETTGKVLATATVTAASPAVGLINYAGIAPTALNTRDTYQIQGTMTTQYYAVGVNSSAAKVAAQINYAYGPQDIFGANGPPGTLNDLGPDFEFVNGTTTTNAGAIAASIDSLSSSRQHQMITTRVLSSLLVGANEQINCGACGSGFAAVGSFAIGAHGRWSLTDRLSLLAGFSVDSYDARGTSVSLAPMAAAALRYDLVDWGRSRPFFEVGLEVAPYESVSYSRAYPTGGATGVGQGSTIDRDASVYGRIGWLARLSPRDEAAVYADLSRSWQSASAYAEATSAANPLPASFGAGVDRLDTTRIGAQYTHLITPNLEANVNAALAYGFNSAVGVQTDVAGYGALGANTAPSHAWGEYGARMGYHFTKTLTLDAFVLGTAGAEAGDNTLHGGVGLRFFF